jgi:hypothetical protein
MVACVSQPAPAMIGTQLVMEMLTRVRDQIRAAGTGAVVGPLLLWAVMCSPLAMSPSEGGRPWWTVPAEFDRDQRAAGTFGVQVGLCPLAEPV